MFSGEMFTLLNLWVAFYITLQMFGGYAFFQKCLEVCLYKKGLS